jgi:hypothetical protein
LAVASIAGAGPVAIGAATIASLATDVVISSTRASLAGASRPLRTLVQREVND